MKGIGRRILSGALAVALAFSLTSCKKKKTSKKTVKESDPYFISEEVKLDYKHESDKNIQYQGVMSQAVIGDKVYVGYFVEYEYPQDLWDDYDFEEEPSDEYYLKILEMLEEYSWAGCAVFDMHGDLLNTIELPSQSQVSCIGEGYNGDILILGSKMVVDDFSQAYEIYRFDEEGNELKSIPVPDEMITWPDSIYEDKDGRLIFSAYDGVSVMSKYGEYLGEINDPAFDGAIFPIGEKFYVQTYEIDTEKNEYHEYLTEIDLENLQLTKNRIEMDMYVQWRPDGQGGCYVITGTGIDRVSLPSGEKKEALRWDSTDVNYSNIEGICFYSDDHIAFARTSYDIDPDDNSWLPTLYVVNLTRAEKNPHAGKAYIDMGIIGQPGDALMDYIISYNKNEENKARIRVRDYAAEEDEETSLTQMAELSDKVYLDMQAGTGPDILVNFSGYSRFNAEEVLVDLNTYLDGDNGINREEYFDNVLSAFEIKDKLFQIPVCFDMRGLLGNKDMIGERSGWTYPEFQQIVSELDPSVTVLEDTVYSDLLDTLLSNSMSSFIDYEKKEVYFDGDEFKQLLSIVKEYGVESVAEFDVEEYMMPFNADSFEGPTDKMNNGILALMTTYVYRLNQYAENAAILDGNVVYVGVPSPDGTGMSATPMLTMAISAFSESKDESWDFIRRMFDEDAQYEYTTSYTSIPLNRKAFDRVNDAVLEENQKEIEYYEQDENDEWVLIPQVKITQEHVDGFRTLVENVSTITSSDPAVLAIIEEEAAAYFADQKSLDEVCSIIQNRTSTIVNER